jgi:hypothetical protein
LAKCSGITQAGSACKGIPIDGSGYCFAHHPAHIEERRRHGARGGRRGGRGRPQVELADIKRRLLELTEGVLSDDEEKRVDKGVAAVASQVLNVYLRAVSVELKAREQLELIERLETLEEGLERTNGGGRSWGA